MPSNIIESNAFTSPLQVPNDTEAANQASLLLFAQGLANRSLFLRQRIPGIADTYNITHALAAMAMVGFAYENTALVPLSIYQSSISGSPRVFIPLAGLPATGRISQVRIDVGGALNTSHVSLPATMPFINLVYQPVTSGAMPVSLGTQADTSASASAYNAPHAITLTLGTPHTIRTDSSYYLIVNGELGAGALENEFYISRLRSTIIPV
jgi:hypothetical protein